MKKIIILLLCLTASVFSLNAQQTIYVIDNEAVEHFDGSQLKGKNVKDYKITTKGSGSKAITVHSITTASSTYPFFGTFSNFNLDPLKSVKFSPDSILLNKGIKVITNKQKKLVYVIDGERYYGEAAATALKEIPSTNIRSVKVLKEGSPEALQYGEDVSVMIITTDRKKKADNETVIVRY